MNLTELMLATVWAAAAAGMAWYCAHVGVQITYVTLADGRRQERTLPLLFRLLLPLVPNLLPLFSGAALARIRDRIDRKLVSAGFEGLLNAREFLALRVLLPLVVGPGWIIVVRAAVLSLEGSFIAKMEPALHAIGLLWYYMYPAFWLTAMLKKRHRAIQRALPFVLDLLTLSVEAGMDFMTALQRNVARGKVDALTEELIRVIREIQLGKTRRQALRDMSVRVNLADLRSVINALVQADELGVSIGFILRIQADQIRLRRFERAEKLANEAPVKMLAPLLLFIFPAVFLILLGPIVARLVEQGF